MAKSWSQGAVRSSWSLISAGSPWHLPRWNLKLAPIYRKPGETKKEAGHSRLGGGRFNKPGNLRTGLGWPRWVNHHINHHTLNVYMEASPGFSHVSRPNHLSNTLLCQGCILEHSFHCENGRAYIRVQDRGSLRLPAASSSVDHPAIAFPCPLPTITCHFLNTSEVFSFLFWLHQLIKTITLMDGKQWGRDHCFLWFKENLESCLYLYHRFFKPDDFQRYTSIFPPHGYTIITITAMTR